VTPFIFVEENLRKMGPKAWLTLSTNIKKEILGVFDAYSNMLSGPGLMRLFTTLGMSGATLEDVRGTRIEAKLVRLLKADLPRFNVYSVCLTLEIFAALHYDWARDLAARIDIAQPLSVALRRCCEHAEVFTPAYYVDALRALNVQVRENVRTCTSFSVSTAFNTCASLVQPKLTCIYAHDSGTET
jgi:hypothetical protein